MVLLGIVCAILGFRVLLHSRRPALLLTGLLLVCALLPLRYTAAFPTKTVKPAPSQWQRVWEWLVGQQDRGPEELARVHDVVIRDACAAIGLAMLVFAAASRRTQPKAAKFTICLAASAFVFFLAKYPGPDWPGLWQRLAFTAILVWLAWLNKYLSKLDVSESIGKLR